MGRFFLLLFVFKRKLHEEIDYEIMLKIRIHAIFKPDLRDRRAPGRAGRSREEAPGALAAECPRQSVKTQLRSELGMHLTGQICLSETFFFFSGLE